MAIPILAAFLRLVVGTKYHSENLPLGSGLSYDSVAKLESGESRFSCPQ